MLSSVTTYQLVAKDMAKSLDRVSKEPQTQRAINYYKANIGKVKSMDEFLGDQRLVNFALEAFGMKDLIYAKGMIRKVLVDGLDSPNAFSLRMADPRFKEFAETFNFKRFGTATTSFSRAQQGTVDRFLRNTLEEQAGASNEAVRLALYFDRKSPELFNEYSILADRAIYTVVRTALGLPDAIAGTDVDQQSKFLASKIDIKDFDDPKKRGDFIRRFLSMYDAKNSSAGASGSPSVTLISGAAARVDMNTLLSMQTLKRFGR